MIALVKDIAVSFWEAFVDLLDAFARVQPAIYAVTAAVVLAATLFINLGPEI